MNLIVVIFIAQLLNFNLVTSLLSQTYTSHESYNSRHLQDSSFPQCGEPLIRKSKIFMSSKTHPKGPSQAYLWGESAWTAENFNFDQEFVIDLGSTKNITGIATQGREDSNEYVLEYSLKFGSNGKDWMDFKDFDGFPKLFKGNTNDNFVVKNEFDQPIIAQWIQVSPTRWQDRISIRVEIFGCDYFPHMLHFSGNNLLHKDLSQNPIDSLKDTIRFRFKTNKDSGIIIYSQGTQGDYLALQMVENRLLLNINLGSKEETSVVVGSLLDDNNFHDVMISRDRRDIIMSVDRHLSRDLIQGEFSKLNLDKSLYVGGSLHLGAGLAIFDNFTGCIENMYFNHTRVMGQSKNSRDNEDEDPNFDEFGEVSVDCPTDVYNLPVTFKNEKGYLKLEGSGKSFNFNVSFEFRTYEEKGLLVHHNFGSGGFIKLFLQDSRVKALIVYQEIPNIEIDNFDQVFNDGKWHKVEFEISKNFAKMNVDNENTEIRRIIDISTGSYYMFGGGIFSEQGFIGCMRHITIDGTYKSPGEWIDKNEFSSEDIALESCYMVDRCTPNPCEHNGVCKQTSAEFFCECENTGYSGALCHTSLNYMSCMQYLNAHPGSQYAETILDLDGSGPLAPFPVRCEFMPDERNITFVGHANEEATKVDGFEEKGSFQQNIYYDATMEMMEALINRSVMCKQKIGYDCKNSRLLNTPVSNFADFAPFGYWISRENKVMDYWGGSLPGSFKCECGLMGTCFDPDKWCNCDSGHDDWLWDGGDITEKQYLPVRALHFGDTGTPLDNKEGRYTLGPLECDGDVLFENVVTFRRLDGAIELPPLKMGHCGDIFLEFKTTSTQTMVLLHNTGESGDFIRISIMNGVKVNFEYSSGKGSQGIVVETPYRLDNNEWHSVLVERNRKEAMLIVDGTRKGQVREPPGPVFPLILTSKLYLGASQDYTKGFVGCVRTLILNGVPIDLVGEVTKNPLGLYGVSVGCVGKCRKKPCKNKGLCMEGYDHFVCDCSGTPYEGLLCADEVGVKMRSNYIIKYDFKTNHKSTLAERIHIGFTTTASKGFLIGAYSDLSHEYFNLMLTDSGHLQLVFDFGFERQEIIFTEQNFLSGQFHDIKVERVDRGQKLLLTIDNYETQIFNFERFINSSTDAQFNNIRYIYLGRNETMEDGFTGCISRVEFNEITPLKLLFQKDPLSNIQSTPETITGDFCGIDPVTLPPEELETRPPASIEEEMVVHHYHTVHSAILGVLLALVFITSVIAVVFVGKYKNRHKGVYITREDEGAYDAFDADTAVLQGKTGHQVEKKKEWFI